MATLEGLERISRSHNAQIIPYIAGANSRSLGEGPGLTKSSDLRVGVDGKYVFRDALTLDFTVNPDFSQVESDDPQVTLNQRYEVFYPEKRPFFFDNAAYFSTPVNLFHSRRVVDPGAGARLTGKIGNWTIGLLGTNDRAPGKSVSLTDPQRGDLASIGVARVTREIGKQSSAGAFFSDREFGPSYNRVAAADLNWRFDPSWTLRAQGIHSDDRERNSAATAGSAVFVQVSGGDRNGAYAATYSAFDPDFRAPLGFIRRVGIRQSDQFLSYYWHPKSGPVTSVGPSTSQSVVYDYSGRLTDWTGGSQFDISFRGPTRLTVSRYTSYEYYLGRNFVKALTGTSFYTARLKWMDVFGSYYRGDAVNYVPAAGLQPFLGLSDIANLGANIHFARFRVESYYTYTRLRSKSSDVVFNNHIARSKLNYQFTRALSARAILDYYAQLPNEYLIDQTRFKQLGADVLITYMVHPGTALYIGYSNRFQNLGIDPANPRLLIPIGGVPLFQTSHLLYFKLSYLLRL